jgi:hypothetical protein
MMALTPTREHTIYRLAAELMATLPQGATGDADRDRIDRAIDLVGTVERTFSPSVYLVRSASTPDAAYRVQANGCNCPDTPRERGAACCKHAYAVQLLNRLERAETDAEQAVITIHVEPEDEAIPYWPTAGEPCALPPQCRRCQAEPACPRHPDGLGKACITNELYGEEV